MKPSDYKYCPRCKSKFKNLFDSFKCGSCGMKIYKTSSPTASILLIKGDKVLLAKRGIEPFKNEYDVVGGFLGEGEHPLGGVLREAKEETGLKVKILEMLGVYMDTYGDDGKATLNFYYIGEIVSGNMRAKDDVSALDWFPINNLPKPAFKNQVQVFKDLKKWYHNK